MCVCACVKSGLPIRPVVSFFSGGGREDGGLHQVEVLPHGSEGVPGHGAAEGIHIQIYILCEYLSIYLSILVHIGLLVRGPFFPRSGSTTAWIRRPF